MRTIAGIVVLVACLAGCLSVAFHSHRHELEYQKHIDAMRREFVKHKFCPSCNDTRWMGDNRPCLVCNPKGTLEVGQR